MPILVISCTNEHSGLFEAKTEDYFGKHWFFFIDHFNLDPGAWPCSFIISEHTQTYHDLNPCFKREILAVDGIMEPDFGQVLRFT